MSDKNKKEVVFRNEDTLVRRAWIESALEGVRTSLSSSFNTLEFGEPASPPAAVAPERQPAADPKDAAVVNKRPALYVAWSAGVRRSGT